MSDSPSRKPRRSAGRKPAASAELLELVADVLVIGGGPAGAWAAISARETGAEVILVDKGFFGTSGATAPSNTETWCVPPGKARDDAVRRQLLKSKELAEPDAIHAMLDHAWNGLHRMIGWKYPFPPDANGKPYLGNLRGPDYMRFMRRHAIGAGVRVLDHHPALELMADDNGVGGATGIDRQFGRPWRARASAVVLATGGCAFGERILGATGLTGDGLLFAAEAGVALTGMEFSCQYAVAPLNSSVSKGMPYRWATFYDCDGNDLGNGGDERQTIVVHAMRKGPVFAILDRAGPDVQRWLRSGQPNCFLTFDRYGIDPFTERFEVTLRAEGTVRGTGGVRLADRDCSTGVDGLYAAGDVASRQHLSGAVTGGGGPNSSWAIASGQIAGRAAAAHARAIYPRRDARRLDGLGEAGLRPRSASSRSAFNGPSAHDVIAEIKRTMIPPETNFFRSETSLAAGRAKLDAAWADLRDHFGNDPGECLKSREAAAMLATGRWALASAALRQESRGMHRRTDFPQTDRAAPFRIVVGGLDELTLAKDFERFGAAAGDERGLRAMIEIVSPTRCTACNICVRICPCNVFDIVPDAPPRIARQDDCQTCFMCEIYCPFDALYVAPNADGPIDITESEVEARGLFGGYVRTLGWTRGRPSGTERDTTRQLRETLTPPKPETATCGE